MVQDIFNVLTRFGNSLYRILRIGKSLLFFPIRKGQNAVLGVFGLSLVCRDIDSRSIRERVNVMTSIGSNDIIIQGFFFFFFFVFICFVCFFFTKFVGRQMPKSPLSLSFRTLCVRNIS